MNESKICLLCLIGLPGAGKTTLASIICNSKLDFSEVVHICYDELIKWGETDELWRNKRKAIYASVEQKIVMFNSKSQSKDTSFLIILDDNMYYRSMRFEFYKLARKMKTKFCQVFFDVPVQVCLERNSFRNLSLPTHHILNMNDKLEHPSQYNYWEKDTLFLNHRDSIENSLELIKSLIILSKVPESLDEEIERDCSQSKKHTADIALRKIVSIIVKEIKISEPHAVSEKVSFLNRKRKEIFNSVQNNFLHLPEDQNVDVYVQHFISFFELN